MPIIAEAKGGKTFELPKEGVVHSVLAEVRDLGLVDSTYKGVTKKVHKVLFRWQLAELDEEGKPKRLYERFTKSLGEKANLRKRVKQMFSKDPPMTLDLETLVGTNTQLVIEHTEKGEKKYANVATCMRLTPGTPKLEIVSIDPPKDKAGTAVTEDAPITDDDIPF